MKSDTHFATTKLLSEKHCKLFVSMVRAPIELLLVLNDDDVGLFHNGKHTSALCSKAYCAKALAPFLNSEMLPTYELWNQVVMC